MYDPYYIEAPLRMFVILIALWTIPWKVYAVWLAAKSRRPKWFVALVLLNTASILELIYVFKIEKKTWPEVKKEMREGWNAVTGKKK
jgi:hypothetical protein